MSFKEFVAVIEAPALRSVALHWQAARGARRMPAWQDLDPAAIAPYLGIVWSWKYDRVNDSFTGRLAGDEITRAFGKDLRGKAMEDFFSGWQFDLIFARHKRVVTEPAFAHGSGPVFIHAERYGAGERIIMPLATDGTHGDGVFGATIYAVPPNTPKEPTAPEPETETVVFFPLD